MSSILSRIGVSGHQGLGSTVAAYVVAEIRVLINQVDPTRLVGVTSLAAGADQLFAHEVVRVGGSLHVVVPCEEYRSTFSVEDRDNYEQLLRGAAHQEVLPFAAPTEEAFLAAGRRVVDVSDVLVAVWDGKPAKGLGGTGDIVSYARASQVEVAVVWPAGVIREP